MIRAHCVMETWCPRASPSTAKPHCRALRGAAQLQTPGIAAEISICVESCCVCVLFQPNSPDIRTCNYKPSDFLAAVRSVLQVFNSRHNFLAKTTCSHPMPFSRLLLVGFFITENHKCDEHRARSG